MAHDQHAPRTSSPQHPLKPQSAPNAPFAPQPMVVTPQSRTNIRSWETKSDAMQKPSAMPAPQRRASQTSHAHRSPVAKQPAPPQVAPDSATEPVKAVISRELPVDYRMLLLALSDQYIANARARSLSIAYQQAGKDEYYRLIAMGLGCMERVTKLDRAWTMGPRTEASVQLKYATLLYEETENVVDTEELLGRGIVFCDQNRLNGLKYSMQNLLVRLLFKTRPRASLKMLDGLIKDCETCQHIPWVYAFRFLRVSLSIQRSSTQDYHAAIVNLRSICTLSKQHSDAAIRMAALVLEAAIHLRARRIDWLTDTQQALASARGLQSIFLPTQLPQLQILTHLVDLACSLDPYEPVLAKQKMQSLHALMSSISGNEPWMSGGTFVVPVKLRGYGDLINDAESLFPLLGTGERGLAFSWLTRNDFSTLSYIVSSATTSAKKLPGDGAKSEYFLNEGLKLMSDDSNLPQDFQNLPLASCFSMLATRRRFRSYLLLQLVSAECNRSDWISASKHLQLLQQSISSVHGEGLPTLQLAATYLEGVISQGCGNLDTALEHYQRLSSNMTPHDTASLPIDQFYAILATMNALLIVRDPSHSMHHQTQPLMSSLQPYFAKHSIVASQNAHLASAYSFLLAVLPQSQTHSLHNPHQQYHNTGLNRSPAPHGPNGITPTKYHLQNSLSAAKRASNAMMAALCICYTNHFLYQGIVSKQAVDAAKLAEALAKQAGVAVWVDFAKKCTQETLVRQEGGGVSSDGHFQIDEKMGED